MKSIKRRLLVSILSVVFAGMIVSVGTTYFALKEEMDELFDQNMKQIAHAIGVHNITEHSEFVTSSSNIRRTLKGEEEFLIQVWDQDGLSFSSLPSIAFPRQGPGGIHTVFYNNEKWRYYGLGMDNGWLVQVSQPIPMRHGVIWEIYLDQLLPTFVQFPVLAGLIWFFVGFGFVPLNRISFLIEQRSAKFLKKLPEQDVPKEVFKMVRALNGLLDRLSGALESQRRFTADAAHELRTPLTAVRLELDLLRKADTQEEREQSLEKLYSAVDRSTRLVQQLLEMARLEPEQASEDYKVVHLRPLVQKLADEIALLAGKKSIAVHVADFDDLSIDGDANALATMISNLVNNAILYTPDGGTVEISAKSEVDKVVLKIADNGLGIPESEHARIFDRFYRIPDSLHSGVTGSGLGLSIVKSIADAHGASIEIAEGLDGKGVSFIIIFPNSRA